MHTILSPCYLTPRALVLSPLGLQYCLVQMNQGPPTNGPEVIQIDADEPTTHPSGAPPPAASTPGGPGASEADLEEREGLRRSNRKRRSSINYAANRKKKTPMSPPSQPEEGKPKQGNKEEEDLSVLGQIKAMRASLEEKIDCTSTKIDKLDTKLTDRIDKQERELKRVNKKIDNNSKTLAETNAEFAKLKALVDKRSDDLPAAINRIVDEKLKASGQRHRPLGNAPPVPSTSAGILSRDSYWRARKSLRLWPIIEEGLEMSVRGFLTNVLKLCPRRVAALEFEPSVLEDKPSREGGPQQPKDVVLVCFNTVEERDFVRASAKNLAGVDAGMKLEIPDHLLGSFRVLNDLAFELKKNYKDLKRNIKFDDGNHDLAMDVRLKPGKQWKTICPDEARKSLSTKKGRKKNSYSTNKLSKMLQNDSSSTSSSESDLSNINDDNTVDE